MKSQSVKIEMNITRISLSAIYILALHVVGIKTVYAQVPAYNFYYGNLHSHSSYSDGNQDSVTSGYTRPRQNYAFADASLHMDFLGISEHNHTAAGMRYRHYAQGMREADSATVDGSFVALYGMEWGVISGGGHMLVYGVNELLGWNPGNYDVFVAQSDYSSLFRQINRRPGAFALFAHPQSGDYNNLFSSTTFNASADSALVGSPMRSGPASSTSIDYNDASNGSYESVYNRMLAKGYHIGISLDHDNHKTTFGRTTPGRLVVLAPALTRADLLTALHARRFYASDDWNAKVSLTLNGEPMGSMLEGTGRFQISVTVADDDQEANRSIVLMRGAPGSGTNAAQVASAASGVASISFSDSLAQGGSRYYYAIVVQADGDRIVTSPIWFTNSGITAIAETVPTIELNIFPNPAPAGSPVSLSYFMNQSTPVSLDVLDEMGRVIASQTGNFMQEASAGIRLETAGLSPGIYTVRLHHRAGVSYKKLALE